MPKESFNPTPEEQASIDEHMGHEKGFLQKQFRSAEELWEKMDQEQREALAYSNLEFDEDIGNGKIIKGEIKGHNISLHRELDGRDWRFFGSVGNKIISIEEARRLFEKYYPIARFQRARNEQPPNEGDAIAATL